MASALELRHVSAGYGETVVLEDIDLALKPGESVSIIGRNGVGKTTLLVTAMGHTNVRSGDVLLDGNSITHVPIYQRAKIGFNVHNRGKYTFGNYRLFELPGNGVMQLSDGGEYLDSFFEVGREIVGYERADDLIDLIRHYLRHDDERVRIARDAYRRVMAEHRISRRLAEAASYIAQGMRTRT